MARRYYDKPDWEVRLEQRVSAFEEKAGNWPDIIFSIAMGLLLVVLVYCYE